VNSAGEEHSKQREQALSAKVDVYLLGSRRSKELSIVGVE
jgi:hypothetical protein